MPVLPAEIPTGLVTGQFYFVSEDAADANTDPELEVVTGVVRFTASAKVLRMVSKKATIIPLTFNATFNSAGHLVSASDPAIGIRLPATNSDLINPRDFTWRVDFFLKRAVDGTTIQIPSYSFSVPADGTVDLTEVMPVSESNGVYITKGDRGDEGDKGDKGDTGLTPNITIGTVVAGEANPADGAWVAELIRGSADVTGALRETFPSTMKGDKGDAGGWNEGTNLGTSDLNTITTPGLYRQASSSGATAERNYPVAGRGGVMTVVPQGSNVLQTFTPVVPATGSEAGRLEYQRLGVAGTWSPWRVFASQRVDNTAGRAIYTWDDTNNREQMVYGDTGVRDISALLGEARTAGAVYVNRNGNIVTMAFTDFVLGALVNIQEFPLLPVGFRPKVWTHFSSSPASSGVARGVLVKADGILRVYLPATQGYTLQASVSFYTADPWPTTLPGISVGTIPNL